MVFNKFDNSRGFAPRPKVQGNWKCSECDKAITELPFEPAEGRPIYCTDCWKKKNPQRFTR